ncbi:MAG: type IX secretion system outer membrane channel protein PorV [Tenacibaculum sp.]
MKRTAILLLAFGLYFNIYSQQGITTATPFLLIASDARSGGMADMGVATSSDAFAIFHNTAKIVFIENQTNIGINYTPWLRNLTDDIFAGNLSYLYRYKENAAFGLSLKYFSLGRIDLTTETGLPNGYKNPNELALTGTYAMKLSNNFSMGVGLKYINSNLDVSDNLNAVNSFAVDISAFYRSEEKNYGLFNGRYRLGINLANIGPKVEYTSGNPNFIPTNLKLGGGFDFIFDSYNILGINFEFTKLLVLSNSNSTKGWFEGIFSSFSDSNFKEELKEITWALGAEYLYDKKFALRTGFFHESQDKGQRQFFTVGLGFKAKLVGVDLSYLMNTSQVNNPLENTLRFSLSFSLGQAYDYY